MDNAMIKGDSVHRHKYFSVRRSTLVMILFVFYLIGCHLRISIYSDGSILLPMFPMLLSAAMLSLLFWNSLLRYNGVTFAIFAIFVLTQPMLTLAPESFAIDTLKASLQLLASVVSALALIYALSTVERARLRRLLLTVWGIIIILGVIEAAGLKPIFDQVKEVLYANSDRNIYTADLRDLAIYGRVRSTVFATEPSFLADTLAGLFLLVFLLDSERGGFKSWLLLGVMIVVSFATAPSFKIVFYIVALFVWQYWPHSQRGLSILLSSLFFFGFWLLIFLEPVSNFLLQVGGRHIESASFYGRITVGPAVAWGALTDFPIYGYGIGNEKGLYPVIAQAWNDSGAFSRFPWFQELSATDLMTNGFWWQWTFLGIIGGLIFTKLIMRLLREIGVMTPLRTIVCVWIVWYAGFAFVDPLSWYIVVIFSIGAVSTPRKLRRSTAFRFISNYISGYRKDGKM